MASRQALRLKASVAPEDDLHADVARALDILLRPPATWTTFPAGQVPLSPALAAKLSRLGLKAGWPDIIVLHDKAFGIELKRQGGKLSKTWLVRTRSGGMRQVEGQTDVFPKLEAAGMAIAVCTSVEDVLGALKRWQIPTREAR